MKIALKVTLLVAPVLAVVSLWLNAAQAAPNASPKANKIVMRADQKMQDEALQLEPTSGIEGLIVRSTSMNDHRDGSRKDSMDYLAVPHIQTSIGVFKAKIIYSQDLNDSTAPASDWGDVPVTYSLIPNKWRWSPPYVISITPFITGVVPASQISLKKDLLRTAAVVGVSFGILPDGISPKSDGAWLLAISITAGQNFHSYDTDINGKVLNRNSSNQTLNLGYNYKKLNFSVEFINKSRWTYQGNTTNSFEHSEEIGYGLSDHFNIAIGHTTAGSGLKANAVDSNLSLVNENDSLIYGSLGISY